MIHFSGLTQSGRGSTESTPHQERYTPSNNMMPSFADSQYLNLAKMASQLTGGQNLGSSAAAAMAAMAVNMSLANFGMRYPFATG